MRTTIKPGGLSKPKLLAIISKVRGAVDARIRGDRREGKYAVVASEGWAGGYRAALEDVEAALRHGYPADSWGFWRDAAESGATEPGWDHNCGTPIGDI